MAWWMWVLIGWTAVGLLFAVLVGRGIRDADRREVYGGVDATPPLTLPAVRGPLPARRRRVPVPPIAAILVTTGVCLEAVGFGLRTSGRDRGTAALLSMDQPMSVPRLYVTALFVAAAGAALLGSARAGQRRPWWVAVGLVALVVAEVKGGGTVHVRVLAAAGVGDRPVVAAIGSALVAAVVLGALRWVSRADRRDRRRVLAAWALYALAAVGLSAVSSLVGQAVGGGSPWTALATFVEESGEVLGAVAVLMSVLVGVAPRLVLPADWALRRTADAETLDAPVPASSWALSRWGG
jgi:hypothetical protein